MSLQKYFIDNFDNSLCKYKLLYLSRAKFENDWDTSTHFHPFTELLIATSGSGKLLIEDREYPIAQGDFAIISPNHMHTKFSAQTPLEYMLVGVENLIFQGFDGEKNLKTQPVFQLKEHSEILNLFLDIEKEFARKKAGYELACQNLLSLTVINIGRELNITAIFDTSKKMNKECAYIKKYIDENYPKNINLDNLAYKTFISKYHLAHAFKKYVGCSPITYLIERRIFEAKKLLATTVLPITKISGMVGFNNSPYFSNTFTKTVGVSPKQYRLNNQKSV